MINPDWTALKASILHETQHGGTLKALPCPFCGLPRSQRSDYIRCQPCGVNWLPGEDLSRDPRLTRDFGIIRPPATTPPARPS